jgi:hypothetical protein
MGVRRDARDSFSRRSRSCTSKRGHVRIHPSQCRPDAFGDGRLVVRSTHDERQVGGGDLAVAQVERADVIGDGRGQVFELDGWDHSDHCPRIIAERETHLPP